MLIKFLRRVELLLLGLVELPIAAIDWSSTKARGGLRSLQDRIRRAI